MSDVSTVLAIGGTGLIGRPVVRELMQHGFTVRVFTRDRVRAATLCPTECELVEGDIRNVRELESAMQGVDVVYTSLSNAMRRVRPQWDADTEGFKQVVRAAKHSGIQRFMRLSAMGVAEAADDPSWWVPAAKLEADQTLIDSGVPYTIFRPTWFMESLPLASLGPHLLALPGSSAPLYWLAGADYGKQVVAALRQKKASNQVFHCQGAEPLSMRAAFRSFAREFRRLYFYTPVPRIALKAMALVSEPMHYLCKLLDMTEKHITRFQKDVNGSELYQPRTTLSQFAEQLRNTTDWPQKSST